MLLLGVEYLCIQTMILPIDINPENSLYFVASLILKTLKQGPDKTLSLYEKVKSLQYAEKTKKVISLQTFLLSLDFLFLLNIIELNNDVISYVHKKS